ncbi:hypothetical protein scyTo_0001847 [Scyliorhinus torazame]|uniref:RHD domain-containing protein n=1 Tax=Scyliorhinus torazame TaxID=75743 RepID=A0A401PG76_SCYTO|nr:hypothetical protein [Scyliorhinus torazame]
MSFIYNAPDQQVDSEEFDFSVLFDNSHDEEFATREAENVAASHKGIVPPSGIGYPTMDVSHYGSQSCSSMASAVLTGEHMSEYGQMENRDFKYYLETAKPPVSSGVESPRIEITPSPRLFHITPHAVSCGEQTYHSPITVPRDVKKDVYSIDPLFLMPPHPFHWAKPKLPCSVPSLPPLEWQLPSRSGSYELKIEIQPKPHHRAHYETEGSRGAVKAPSGGHPVVQLHGCMENKPLSLHIFIGTADERLLRPHAFYQVHRITGKTVSTTSYEKICGNTKVLEIPLLPENNMKAV